MSKGLLSLDLAKNGKNFFETNLIFIVPGLLILATVVAQICGMDVTLQDEGLATFVSDFLFLNNSHAVFSLVAMVFIPEAAAVVANRKKLFSIMTLGLTAIIVGIIVTFKINPSTKIIFEIILGYFSLWHSMKQTYGLARLYSMKHLKEIKNESEIIFEKALLYLLLSLSVLFNPRTLARYTEYFNIKLNVEWLHQVSMVAMIGLLVLLCIINLKHVKSVSEGFVKILYLLPNLVFPLSTLSLLGFVLLRAVHGIQAWFIYKNILEVSSATKQQKNSFLMGCSLLMMFQALVYTFLYDETQNGPNILFSSMSFSISYLHLYHERFLFKVNNQPKMSLI